MTIHDYKTALVTGASSGIGAACVRSLTQAGLHVVAVARREDRLDDLAQSTGCEPLVLDLRDTEAIYETIGEMEIDILVNNAGLGRAIEKFTAMTPEDIDEIIGVNVAAALHVVRAVLPGMVMRSNGHVVHLGSTAGLHTLGLPAYAASKGAVHSFARDLRLELAGSGLRHTEICPGRVRTEFFDKALARGDAPELFMDGFDPLEAEDIAESVMFAIGSPMHVNISLIELTSTQQVPGGSVIVPERPGG